MWNKLNRNHWSVLGFLILLIGLQFYLLDSVKLTPDATEFLAKVTSNKNASTASIASTAGIDSNYPAYEWKPKDVIPHSLLTMGFVLVFTTLTMKKPE